MKPIISLSLFLFLSLSMQAQQMTVVPDSSFEQTLIDKGIDSDGVINGQLPTADAEAVTSLDIDGCEGGYTDISIEDFTGLEDFVNLDTLKVNCTKVHALPLNTLSQLTYLFIGSNYIEDLDLSGNPALEYLYIVGFSDYLPNNFIESVDLSHNPNLNDVSILGWVKKEINLANGNNNPDMDLDISGGGPYNESEHICIKVDDPQAAKNNDYPYSEWNIIDAGFEYTFTDDLEECLLGVHQYKQTALKLYPNPAQEAVHIAELNTALRFDVYNLSGQQVLRQKISPANNRVDLTQLSTGVYLYKMRDGKQVVKTGKLVKE